MSSSRNKLPPLNGMPLSDFSIRHPVLITMVLVLIIVGGILAYTRMPVNLLPDINLPAVTVRVVYPGAGPATMADQVARPIEDELTAVSGVKKLTSTAAENVAVIAIEFVSGVDADLALQDVRQKVAGIRGQLPQGIEEPVFEKVDPAQDPVLSVAFTSEGQQDARALRQLLANEIVPRVQQAGGVGSTTLSGGLVRQIEVQLDLRRLQALGILPSQVSSAVEQGSTDIGLGDALAGEQEVNLRAPSVFRTPQDIAAVGIAGTRFAVGDVATIVDGAEDVETLGRFNGRDAIILDIRKQSGTNTVAVAEAALAQLETVIADYPDLRFDVVANQAEDVRKNVKGAIEEIFIAIGFAVLVVLFFFSGWRNLLITSALPALVLVGGIAVLPALGIATDLLYVIGIAVGLLVALTFFRDRNTAVTVLGLPVIMVGTFALMYAFGITINILSLLALSISVGLVIDDAIVVRENVFRYLERGERPIIAASKATAQVAASVLAMTLTIIAVFVPAALTTGIVGIIFFSFGITVASAMALSLFEAFTLAPTVSAYWTEEQLHHKPLPARKPGEENLPDEALEELGPLEYAYERAIRWSLHHRLLMLGITLGVIVLSVVAASGIKFAFLPSGENYRFGIGLALPPGTPLTRTDAIAREVEQIIAADEGVESVLTVVGSADDGSGGAEQASFEVLLDEEGGAKTPAVQERLRAALASYDGITFSVAGAEGGTSTEVTARPLQVAVRGTTTNPADLAPIVDQLIGAFAPIAGLADLDTSYRPGKPALDYRLRVGVANDYGLTNQTLAATMRALLDGDEAAKYREGGREYDIVVRLRPEDRTTVDQLQNVRLPLGGTVAPLSTIATIETATSPTSIRRVDRQTEILIGANNLGRNINQVQADMQAQIDQLQLPPGVSVSFGGATADQGEGFGQLAIAMGLGVLLVYMVLASQFGSFLQPLLIMVAMPLSFMGAFLALRLTGRELDVLAMIGMLMLLGLVVKNSILLVDFTNTLQAAGMPTEDAIVRAGGLRLRPILMTSAAIVLGGVPAAVGIGDGAALRQGLATVVIGGVLTSTLLTLLLIPIGYSLLQAFTDRLSAWQDARRSRRRQRRERATQSATALDSAAAPDADEARAELATPTPPLAPDQPDHHDANHHHDEPVEATAVAARADDKQP
jgi:hydrophobic/amphiphilic exporter-1 (mainly G- bacteria), HAE1 family